MKKLLLSLGVVLMGLTATAQEPDYNVAPDFTVTDTDGNTHNLYTYLDQGYTVVLDLFATWCGPCWNYKQTGALDDLYNAHGPNGDQTVMVIAIEVDGSTPVSELTGSSLGDWTSADHPVADEPSVGGLFNLAYYPTIIAICPDRYAFELGQQPASQILSLISSCPSVPTAANDPRIMGQTSDEAFCSGSDATVRAVIQNYGTSPLTSATIEVFDGTTSVVTKAWTGNLAQYGVEEIVVGTVSPTAATTYTIKITSTNDDVSNDEISAAIAPADGLITTAGTKTFTFDVVADGYPAEFGMVFDEGLATGTPYDIMLAAYQGTTTPLAVIKPGDLTSGSPTASVTVATNNDGCHTLTLYDDYGDGLTDPSNGSITITDGKGTAMNIDVAYGDGINMLFDLSENTSSVQEIAELNGKLYPNPVKNQNAILELADLTENTTVTLTDVAGKVISIQNVLTNGRIELPTANLNAGVYLVTVSSDNGTSVAKIIVE